MSRLPLPASCIVVLAGVALGIGTAHGQVARSGGGAGAQLAQELQQAAAERAELQAQNAKLQKELEATRKERDAAKAADQALERRSKLSESAVKQLQENIAASRQATDKEIAKWRDSMQELVAKAREIAQNLRDVETDRNALKQTLATRDRDLKTCADRNLALYQISEEALTRLDHQGFWSSVSRAEPFTKIKRIQLDNLVEEYRERADAQRMPAPTQSGPALPGAAGTSPPTAASK
jgi:chromosome segregation ATPase